MKAKQLFEILREVDDDVEIVVEAPDHSYWSVGVTALTTALKHTEQDSYSSGFTEDPHPGEKLPDEYVKLFGPRVPVFFIGV